ncbi:MAG: SLBB domain-containing protein [Prevotella sp.]|jgi:protein involved in polysaccharide export with SLBB domain|nr:SLBB domain-containing protein [Prevotella sp.]
MKNRFFLLLFFFNVLSSGIVYAQISMTDDQIVEFISDKLKNNVSQQDIAKELLRRGVTPVRIQQIQQKYGQSQETNKQTTAVTASVRGNPLEQGVTDKTFSEVSEEAVVETPIFGHNIFNNQRLTFEPDAKVPTPVNYVLGPGDEIVIEIWGASQMTIRETITSEGNINVENIGPVYLNGMTVEEANKYLRSRFSNVFAGVGDGSSQLKLTVGQIRTMQVNVMGEVVAPGNYAVSSLATVLHALYRAGGVNEIGSLRAIKIYRDGKLLKMLDIYQSILNGQMEDDIRLNDRDVVIVPPYDILVDISGKVKRPLKYEMKQGETVSDLLKYAGGFSGDAYTDNIRLTRPTGNQNKMFTLDSSNYSSFELRDGDLLVVASGLELFDNRVEVKGAVFRGGFFEIGDEIKTMTQLLEKAGGLRGDAFLNRAVLLREKNDLTSETLAIDLKGLINGTTPDIPLRKNDVLYIPSLSDLTESKVLTIYGEVLRPGEYSYADNTTLEDLIIRAGGLLESASLVKVDVARRVSAPHSTTGSKILSETYSFGLKDGLVVDGEPGFVLEAYDHIYVRKSPGYHSQQNIEVQGEVTFPGKYALNKKTERISDLVKRAGNLTDDAYPQGARFIRRRNDEERFRSEMAVKMSKQVGQKDSIAVESLNLSEHYDIGIELDKAIAHPGSDYDLILREGDKLIIPECDNTVKINGAVMRPNTVLFKEKEKISYYINQAGGFTDRAKKKNMYVIYMNGMVSKVKSGDKNAVQPGCEIVVPVKEPEKEWSTAEILSVGSSITNMSTAIAALIYLISR